MDIPATLFVGSLFFVVFEPEVFLCCVVDFKEGECMVGFKEDECVVGFKVVDCVEVVIVLVLFGSCDVM